MKFLKKLFAPKEVKAAVGVIDEFEYSCNTSALRFVVRFVPHPNRWVDPFSLVREVVESTILEQSDKFISVIKEQGITPRQKVYSMMEHVAGDYLVLQRYKSSRNIIRQSDNLLQENSLTDFSGGYRHGCQNNYENQARIESIFESV